MRALVLALAAVGALALVAQAQTTPYRSLAPPQSQTRAQVQPGQVVRLRSGARIQDIAQLRNDQVLETPSGRHITVARFRQIMGAFQQARQRTSAPRAQGFAILAPAIGPGQPRRRGETAAQLLARPPTDVIRMSNGHTVTVAQLRAMAPYVQKTYGLNFYGPQSGGRPRLDGPAIRINSVAQLKSIPPSTPDSTVLETPKGTRITVGELRNAMKQKARSLGVPLRQGGAQ